MIVWGSVQAKLAARGFAPGPVDNVPGRDTYTALFGYTANRKVDAVLRSMGAAAARELPKYGMTEPHRLGEFLAETCHESAGFTRFEESLRYSAKRLMAVWPNRFPTLASALPYAWDPTDADREDVALANLTYGKRMGNETNGTADNDGWDHRGRGLLQHTGAEEYMLLKLRLGVDPDQVADPATSVRCALDFWQRKDLNAKADRGDFTALRKAVNGGTLGLAQIGLLRGRVLQVLT